MDIRKLKQVVRGSGRKMYSTGVHLHLLTNILTSFAHALAHMD